MDKFRKLFIIFLLLLSSVVYANNAQQEGYKHDYLYSQEYFDYLIECAQAERQQELEEIKAQKKAEEKQQKSKDNENEEIVPLEEDILSESIIKENYEPFKLHIESYEGSKYKETLKKEDTKILIPVNDKFSYMTDTITKRSKYNSQDYKILAGAEYALFDFLSFSGGLETNYRGLDQNPNSRKLFLTPKLSFSDKVSIIFPNKINIHSHTTDHDIGINVSPFKSKFMDFGVYGGLTRTSAGSISESINFSTNLYFF